jgi:hypothetical protein
MKPILNHIVFAIDQKMRGIRLGEVEKEDRRFTVISGVFYFIKGIYAGSIELFGNRLMIEGDFK